MEKVEKETEESIHFLFDITEQVKQFYETPVIFLTKKDFSDIVFNTMCNIRRAFRDGSKQSQSDMIDHIVDFHLEWLHAVNDIEQFKKHVSDIPREEVYQAISFTVDAMNYRLKYYKRYMEKNLPKLSNIEQVNMNADLEIVEEMHKDVIPILLNKLKTFRNQFDDEQFKQTVYHSIDELLSWLDKINDGISRQLSKYINLNVPQLTGDLTKTLQQIVDEFQASKTDASQQLLSDLKNKGRELSTMIRYTATRNLEISKLLEKIAVVEDRINRLEEEEATAAVMALKHKKEFLEGRLASLENLKTTLKELNEQSEVNFDEVVPEEEICECHDFYLFRIFNHALPPDQRERLVTELCYLWDLAIFGERSHKSIISILSAADVREEFTDELGTFYLDDNSRKIYKVPGDETLYQPNELNELVPLSDDANHIYYYDECGRYYVDEKTRERVYKAHATASEYVMDTTGVLLKIKEERDGITYYYDNYGRYFVNSEGKHIYREEDSISEYEHDGLGNLVRIRSHPDIFEPCPDDVRVSDDFKYLKCVVGPALRTCIAEVILRQPADPIKYLSARLENYRETIELRDRRAREKEELEVEREIIREEERAAAERAALEAALLAQGGSEASYDSNLLNYAGINDGEVSASSK